MPHSDGCDPVDWFVRRAGLARFSTIACALGVVLAAVAGLRPGLAVTGLALALAGLSVGLLRRSCRWGYRLLIVSVLLSGLLSGCVLGGMRVTALSQSGLLCRAGEVVDVELVVTGSVRKNSGWQSATASIRRLESAISRETIWLEVPPGRGNPEHGDLQSQLHQGMILACRAKIEAPDGPSESGYDQSRHLLQQGIVVVLRVWDPGSIRVLGQRGGVAGWFDGVRRGAREHLHLGPILPVNEVLEGVVMGDPAGIERDWLEAFRRSGTAHMLSVSGLHVASLAAIVIGVARLLGAARWVGFLLAAASALFMIPFVGPSPPIIRAAVMIVIVLVGRWGGRGRDQWQILALAAVVILALNPFAVYDVGFQLSFSAVSGILALTGPLQRLLKRLPETIAANVSVSLAASAGTAPVALAVFGRTSLVSPLANLLVVPALPLVTGLGMASALMGFAWTGLSVGLDTLVSLPLTWVVVVSRTTALVPVLNSGDVGRMLAALAGIAVVLPAALALIGRVVRAPFGLPLPFIRSSLSWLSAHRPRSRRLGHVLAAGVVMAGVVLGLVMYPVGAHGLKELRVMVGAGEWPDQVEVRVLDVGQGNAVLVRTPGRHALLFDGGPDNCGLGRQLNALGVERLDLVVMSHPHADHFTGLLESLEGLEVVAVVDHVDVRSGLTTEGAFENRARARPAGAQEAGKEAMEYLRLRDRLEERGCRHSLVGTGSSAYVDGVTVQFFAPKSPIVLMDGKEPWAARGDPPSGDELNDTSLVTVVKAGRLSVLLPGDAEAAALGRYDLPTADVLVVSHHGSQGAVSQRLMDALGCRVAVISVGKANSFGHPSEDTVSLLRTTARTVVRTDEAGWVSCRLREEGLAITTERTPSNERKGSSTAQARVSDPGR